MKLGTFNHLSPSSPIFSSFPPLLELFLIRFEEQFPSAEATSGRHRLRQRCESLTIPSSNQKRLVPRIFFESRRFNLSNNDGVIARAAFVCPWRSPSKPVLPSQRIRLPRLRKPDSNSSNRNRLVPPLFLKSPQIKNSNLMLIFRPSLPSFFSLLSASRDFLTIHHSPFTMIHSSNLQLSTFNLCP